ncbi:hypothetical protein [Empedobacter tilapiae]|uniref:Cupin n=1 Tax=Empedobacter tilapiae TaxID=2491114 RepID=A0A4Z1B9H0_9FLAO|nr:hypothetical protein [Empedobacter tilapiae]TGN21660.1 hypothetical protein E4J94_17075 [Empedobacter tilapiae]
MDKSSSLNNIHANDKNVGAISIFKGESSNVTSIQLLEKSVLKEHSTKIPALLLCVTGKVLYLDENEQKIELSSSEYITIEPNVIHKLEALENSQLILVK